MKISAQEEYGLRILITVAKRQHPMTIAEISNVEGLTHHNAAKLCRILRMNGYLKSEKGHTGGYDLAKPAAEIALGPLMKMLGGALYDGSFCERFSGENQICTNSVDCTIRCLWAILQKGIDSTLGKLTLQDLLGTENQMNETLAQA